MIRLKEKLKIGLLAGLCLIPFLSGGCGGGEQAVDRDTEEGEIVSAVADMLGTESREEASARQTNTEATDYEQRLEQAIEVLEGYFSEPYKAIPLLREFQEEIEPVLPEYMQVKDICHGEMGVDKEQHIAVVLKFAEEYPYETGDGVLAYGQKVLCVFRERKEGGYQCEYSNNRLLLDEGAYPRYGSSIYIRDGLLTVSQDMSWVGQGFSFGYNGSQLELFRVYEYKCDTNNGEGTVVYYNFLTGTAEGYTIENYERTTPVNLCFVKGFSTNGLHSIAFEDTDANKVLRNIEYICSIEEDYLLKAIENQVVLTENTEIESYEWVDEEKTCFRVRVHYQEPPEESYQHKEDYFFFLKDETVQQVLYVDYPLKTGTLSGDYPDRYPMSASDFDAHLEDVTFDGNADLIISLGDSRWHAISCAYVYENGGYRYEPTFEDIPSYETDAEQNIIRGCTRSGAASYTDLVYEYRDGAFVVRERHDYQQYHDENGDVQEIEVD